MRPTLLVFRREFAGYFATPVAAVFLIVFLALAAGDKFSLSRTGDTVVLTFTPVPEPALTVGFVAGVFAMGRLLRRGRAGDRVKRL